MKLKKALKSIDKEIDFILDHEEDFLCNFHNGWDPIALIGVPAFTNKKIVFTFIDIVDDVINISCSIKDYLEWKESL